jgi:carbamoyl-phosphate synthase small subunit
MPLSVLKSAFPPAVLALADGTVFHGASIGAAGETSGEVVFNTSMTGYQEILSDPSYARQIVTLTYPHIGNTGTNSEDMEADHLYADGLVIRDLPRIASNFRSTQSLQDFLKSQKTVAIAEVDTRRLTRLLRDKGAQNGAIVAGSEDPTRALELARSFPGLAGMDLAREVGVKESYVWMEGKWALGRGYEPGPAPKFHVVAFDYGVKRNILRLLAARGCKVTVLPPMASAEQALALSPDGIFLSNGPGDPEPCDYAIKACRLLMDKLPVFGICLGHQIMGLAVGARTHKMKFGHHGANHPVQDLESKQVLITSQNHGFAVDPKTLPANCKVTHVSLFDGSMQGFRLLDKPSFCFQGHPEASPGPHDIGPLFDRFVALMQEHKHG